MFDTKAAEQEIFDALLELICDEPGSWIENNGGALARYLMPQFLEHETDETAFEWMKAAAEETLDYARAHNFGELQCLFPCTTTESLEIYEEYQDAIEAIVEQYDYFTAGWDENDDENGRNAMAADVYIMHLYTEALERVMDDYNSVTSSIDGVVSDVLSIENRPVEPYKDIIEDTLRNLLTQYDAPGVEPSEYAEDFVCALLIHADTFEDLEYAIMVACDDYLNDEPGLIIYNFDAWKLFEDYQDECEEAFFEYGYTMGEFQSVDDIVWQMANCYVNSVYSNAYNSLSEESEDIKSDIMDAVKDRITEKSATR